MGPHDTTTPGDRGALPVIAFRYRARLGHFLRAESSASALSYPFPPRTALLGLCGAVLGLSKDTPQEALAGARFAVIGRAPRTHWHRAKLRKTTPEQLALSIEATGRATTTTRPDEEGTLIRQELLIDPLYSVVATLPEPFHSDLAERLTTGRWHFTPSMGLSGFIARLEWLGQGVAEPLPAGTYDCASLAAADDASVDTVRVIAERLAVALGTERLPRAVTTDRVFTHATYYVERLGRSFPVQSAAAWRARWGDDEQVLLWL